MHDVEREHLERHRISNGVGGNQSPLDAICHAPGACGDAKSIAQQQRPIECQVAITFQCNLDPARTVGRRGRQRQQPRRTGVPVAGGGQRPHRPLNRGENRDSNLPLQRCHLTLLGKGAESNRFARLPHQLLDAVGQPARTLRLRADAIRVHQQYRIGVQRAQALCGYLSVEVKIKDGAQVNGICRRDDVGAEKAAHLVQKVIRDGQEVKAVIVGHISGHDRVPPGAGDDDEVVAPHRRQREPLRHRHRVLETLGVGDARLPQCRADDAVVVGQRRRV